MDKSIPLALALVVARIAVAQEFVALGPSGSECRGPGPSDLPSYYTLHESITAEQDCKDLCLADAACEGIQYSSLFEKCEVWTSSVDTFVPAVGYTCYILQWPTTTSATATSTLSTISTTKTSTSSSATMTTSSSETRTQTFSTWSITSTLSSTPTATMTATSTATATGTVTHTATTSATDRTTTTSSETDTATSTVIAVTATVTSKVSSTDTDPSTSALATPTAHASTAEPATQPDANTSGSDATTTTWVAETAPSTTLSTTGATDALLAVVPFSGLTLSEREMALAQAALRSGTSFASRQQGQETMAAQALSSAAFGSSMLNVSVAAGTAVFVPGSFLAAIPEEGVVVATSLDPGAEYPQLEAARLPGVVALLSIRAVAGGRFQSVAGLTAPLRFRLNLGDAADQEAFCAFWDEDKLRWSDQGMETLGRDEEGFLLCATNHLTLFGAILEGFAKALLCSQASLLSSAGLQAILGGTWYAKPEAKLLWLAVTLQTLLMSVACACDRCRRAEGAWLDENFLTQNQAMVKASLLFAKTRGKTGMIAPGRTKVVAEEDLKELASSGCCSSLKETAMNFLDVVGSTFESSFSYVRNFVVCAWETFCDLLVPSGGGTRRNVLRRLLARLVATSLEYQACAALWRSREDVRFLAEERRAHMDNGSPSQCGSTRASSPATAWKSGQDSSADDKINFLHHVVGERLERQHQLLLSGGGRGAFLCRTAAALFLSQAPWLTVLHKSIFMSCSMGALLLLCRISGALAVTALFWQTGGAVGADSSEMCTPKKEVWDSLGKCIAVALATVVLAAIPEIVLSKLHKREFKKLDSSDPGAAERILRRWHRRDRMLWVLGTCYIGFCLLFVISFLANVTPEDVRDWEVSAIIEICTELFFVPMFMSWLFFFVTAVSACWTEVAEESGEHIGCVGNLEPLSIVPSERPEKRARPKALALEVALPGLLQAREPQEALKRSRSDLSFGKVLSCGA